MRFVERCLLSLVLTLAATSVRAAEDGTSGQSPPQAAQPPSPAPTQSPPAPPSSLPPAPAPATRPRAPSGPDAPAAPAAATGQWVYTAQYGWVWMPHAEVYTYAPPDGDPYMYVYSVGIGWRWVVAPWVVGVGPIPYFGVPGPSRFVWYQRWPSAWRAARPAPVPREARERGFREHAFHEPFRGRR